MFFAKRGAALVALALGPCAGSAPGQESIRLGACDRTSSVQPDSVTITCADAGVIAHDLAWQNWGAAQATATGSATVKSCDPDCATGGTDEYAVALTADRIRTCRDGSQRYTRVRYDWPQESPFPPDAPGTLDPYVEFPCPLPRPHLNGMRMKLTGHGDPGANYYVRVTLRLRICAPKQHITAMFDERKSAGSNTFAEHNHAATFAHPGGCRWRSVKWKLRDEFFGIGTYTVTARLLDSQGQTSRRLTRRSVTND